MAIVSRGGRVIDPNAGNQVADQLNAGAGSINNAARIQEQQRAVQLQALDQQAQALLAQFGGGAFEVNPALMSQWSQLAGIDPNSVMNMTPDQQVNFNRFTATQQAQQQAMANEAQFRAKQEARKAGTLGPAGEVLSSGPAGLDKATGQPVQQTVSYRPPPNQQTVPSSGGQTPSASLPGQLPGQTPTTPPPEAAMTTDAVPDFEPFAFTRPADGSTGPLSREEARRQIESDPRLDEETRAAMLTRLEGIGEAQWNRGSSELQQLQNIAEDVGRRSYQRRYYPATSFVEDVMAGNVSAEELYESDFLRQLQQVDPEAAEILTRVIENSGDQAAANAASLLQTSRMQSVLWDVNRQMREPVATRMTDAGQEAYGRRYDPRSRSAAAAESGPQTLLDVYNEIRIDPGTYEDFNSATQAVGQLSSEFVDDFNTAGNTPAFEQAFGSKTYDTPYGPMTGSQINWLRNSVIFENQDPTNNDVARRVNDDGTVMPYGVQTGAPGQGPDFRLAPATSEMLQVRQGSNDGPPPAVDDVPTASMTATTSGQPPAPSAVEQAGINEFRSQLGQERVEPLPVSQRVSAEMPETARIEAVTSSPEWGSLVGTTGNVPRDHALVRRVGQTGRQQVVRATTDVEQLRGMPNEARAAKLQQLGRSGPQRMAAEVRQATGGRLYPNGRQAVESSLDVMERYVRENPDFFPTTTSARQERETVELSNEAQRMTNAMSQVLFGEDGRLREDVAAELRRRPELENAMTEAQIAYYTAQVSQMEAAMAAAEAGSALEGLSPDDRRQMLSEVSDLLSYANTLAENYSGDELVQQLQGVQLLVNTFMGAAGMDSGFVVDVQRGGLFQLFRQRAALVPESPGVSAEDVISPEEYEQARRVAEAAGIPLE